MKTLIELYDERPLENVLGTEVFRPETTVFVCPENVARDGKFHEKLREYFRRRGAEAKLVFKSAPTLDAQAVAGVLGDITGEYEDCALDISGGTDAALFAGGLFCAGTDIPVYTYSRRRNTFFGINNAAFAEGLKCGVQLDVEDCVLMAGGAVRKGRAGKDEVDAHIAMIDPLFKIYLCYRRDWVKLVTYIVELSQHVPQGSLDAQGPYTVPGPRGSRIKANEDALRDLRNAGLINSLKLEEDGVSFRFADQSVRKWLRDIGSVLELYVYKACRDSGLFNDVRLSVIVDWEGENRPDAVTNEIDVMASRAVMPVFISCKTCEVKTEALNELAILRDRFGGQSSRAVIVTSENGREPMRSRAAELGIDVVELKDLKAGALKARLAAIVSNRRG